MDFKSTSYDYLKKVEDKINRKYSTALMDGRWISSEELYEDAMKELGYHGGYRHNDFEEFDKSLGLKHDFVPFPWESWLYEPNKIKNVIFNDPATIVFWGDGTKTVVKCQEGDTFDKEKGLAMAFVKHSFDGKGNYNDIFRKWIQEE